MCKWKGLESLSKPVSTALTPLKHHNHNLCALTMSENLCQYMCMYWNLILSTNLQKCVATTARYGCNLCHLHNSININKEGK